MDHLVERVHSLPLDLQPSYLLAVSELTSTFASTPSGATDPASIARIFNWLALLSDVLLEGLRSREEVAMEILDTWARLLEGGEAVWYLRGWKDAISGALRKAK